MNLHHLVRPAITAVNADIPAVLLKHTGTYSTDDAGIRTPSYQSLSGNIQVQGVNGRDLQQMNHLNMQGIFRTVYLYGALHGVMRNTQKGGDILKFADVDGVVYDWLVVQVAEVWSDWSKVIVCQQLSQT